MSKDAARMILEDWKGMSGSPGLNIIKLAEMYDTSRLYVQGVVDGAHAQTDITWDKFRGVE